MTAQNQPIRHRARPVPRKLRLDLYPIHTHKVGLIIQLFRSHGASYVLRFGKQSPLLQWCVLRCLSKETETELRMLEISLLNILALLSTLTQVTVAGSHYLLNGHLKVAASPWKPFISFYCNGKEMGEYDECPDQDTVTYDGTLWQFLKLIKLKRNVTFSLLRPPSPKWGYCHGENNCTGMIGMVQRREVDFALGMVYQFLNWNFHTCII